ncbi:hypothetical protein U1Q18_031104 [Sarracenia purpurea var. burkii]
MEEESLNHDHIINADLEPDSDRPLGLGRPESRTIAESNSSPNCFLPSTETPVQTLGPFPHPPFTDQKKKINDADDRPRDLDLHVVNGLAMAYSVSSDLSGARQVYEGISERNLSIMILTDVAFSHNELSSKLPDLSPLISPHVLNLRENHLDSVLPFMPKGLTTILLSKNSFSGKNLEQFSELNQLQHLDLSSNILSGTPPSTLFSSPNISYLNLASNMLSGSFPNRLSCRGKLGFVDISSKQHPESNCKATASVETRTSKRKETWVLISVQEGHWSGIWSRRVCRELHQQRSPLKSLERPELFLEQ